MRSREGGSSCVRFYTKCFPLGSYDLMKFDFMRTSRNMLYSCPGISRAS
jgi:hypothetical protein